MADSSSLESSSLPFHQALTDRAELFNFVNSIFESAIHDVPSELGCFRPLKTSEIGALKSSCFCRCSDWSRIRLWIKDHKKTDNDYSCWLEKHISFNTFDGLVVISVGPNDEEIEERILDQHFPAGIHFNSIISNCILDQNCRVYRNSVLKDTYVGSNSTVVNNGQITSSGTVDGKLKLTIGPESGGGRNLIVNLESTMVDVCQKLGMGSRGRGGSSDVSNPVCRFNLIGHNCLVRDSPSVHNVVLMPTSAIEAATLVDSAMLMPSAVIQHGSTVKQVLLQWDTCIANQSYVSNVLLMEQAHAGPHSFVQDSILGPDVHVSAGEVHASLLGPNTNAHHQSLVISVLWPLGRGNVGYGANVGSNHTGRLPDQETVAAEGTFWGLSSVIKFPVDLSGAPYSIIAAGTNVIAQRISMPFSLVVDMEGICQIMPGWVWSSSPYTLARSETKFATRRKAKRHAWYTGWQIFRPDTMQHCLSAREALQNCSSGQKEHRHVPGIGKCVMTEKARQAGIAVYTACLRRYALLGLLQWYQQHPNGTVLPRNTVLQIPSLSKPSWPVLPWEDRDTLEHQLEVLRHEYPSITPSLLKELVTLEYGYADGIKQSKDRDYARGLSITPEYALSHDTEDAVVQQALQRAQEVEKAVNEIMTGTNVTCNRSRL
jgi:NDP-sugar pyrophosphorylase family protein